MVERHYLIGTYFFSEIIFGGYNIINNLDSPKKEGSNATPYNTYGNKFTKAGVRFHKNTKGPHDCTITS